MSWSYLDYGSPGNFFIFDGLRVLVFKERLWVVDIVQ